MNPTDAEIAGKLDGMECENFRIDRFVAYESPALTISDLCHDDKIACLPHDLLALCRAVVSEVDGERTDKTYTDFMHEWIRRRNNGSNDQPEAAKESVWAWVKWAWKIAAVTERHRKGQG